MDETGGIINKTIRSGSYSRHIVVLRCEDSKEQEALTH